MQRERDRIERNLSLERERQIEMASSRATTSDTYDTGLREQPITMVQRDLIATVLDMKVDVHLEMQRMSTRIGRLEDLLTELIRKISDSSSGQSTPADDTIQNVTTPGGSISIAAATTTASTASSFASATSTVTMATTAAGSSSTTGTSLSGTQLGPILLRKRRSKSRKAPAPPKTSPEQTRLLEAELPSSTTPSVTRKREFL